MAYDTHFLIPFASSLDNACQAAIKTLQLPNLTRFLRQAEVMYKDSGDEFDFIPPHERVLGLTQQVIVTPCHWSVGIDNIRMENPHDLQLTEGESEEIFAAVLPYFSEDDIALTYQSAVVWHANSPQFNDLPLASLDRAIGRNVDVWQPPALQSKSIRRLQNEMQMLLYTHPLNDAREARGLPTVNSFWLSHQVSVPVNSHYCVDSSLRESTLQSDWHSWLASWQTIDIKLAQATEITLCGERHSVRLAEPLSRTLGQKVKRLFQPKPSVQSILESL